MVIYTSGTTGKPKGAVHVHGGFLVKIAEECAFQTDVHADDRFMWVTDMGWIMGPKMVVGAGALGATLVPQRRRARPPRPGPAVGAGRAPPDHRARRLTDADPGPQSPRRRAGAAPRPLVAADPGLDRRAVEPRALPLAARGRAARAAARSSTSPAAPRSAPASSSPMPVMPLKECTLGAPSLGHGDGRRGRRRRAGRRAGEVGELVCRQPWPSMTRGVWRDPERYLGGVLVAVPRRLGARRLGFGRRGRLLVPARPLRRHAEHRRQADRPGRVRVRGGRPPGRRRGLRGRRPRRRQGRGRLALLRPAAGSRRPTSWPTRCAPHVADDPGQGVRAGAGRVRAGAAQDPHAPRSSAAPCGRRRWASTRATSRRWRTPTVLDDIAGPPGGGDATLARS